MHLYIIYLVFDDGSVVEIRCKIYNNIYFYMVKNPWVVDTWTASLIGSIADRKSEVFDFTIIIIIITFEAALKCTWLQPVSFRDESCNNI